MKQKCEECGAVLPYTCITELCDNCLSRPMQDRKLLELPKSQPFPCEATGMADLITPFQVELVKDFCRRLKTKPQIEASAMFGNGVSFYRLSRQSADALTMALRNAYVQTREYQTLAAFQATYDAHNAPDHIQAKCELCVTHRPEPRSLLSEKGKDR